MFVYIGKNLWFTACLDSNLHTRLTIVTKNELGPAFPPRNLPKKFRPDPSTFYLVIMVTNRQTDRQTDRQTNAGKNIIPRFCGDNKNVNTILLCPRYGSGYCDEQSVCLPVCLAYFWCHMSKFSELLVNITGGLGHGQPLLTT